MTDSLLNAIIEVVDFAFDLSATIDRTRELSKPDIVQVPPDPRSLTPAARRALAEAEDRERKRAVQAAHTANEPDHAS
jgi:hypothetical protein